MKDAELIKLLKRSPNKGMEMLMDQYIALVCTIARHRLSDICSVQDIEECVSDVFIAFYQGIDRFDPEKGSIKALLCSIARNKAVDLYNQRIQSAGDLSLDDEIAVDTASDEFSLEDEYISLETKKLLAKAISELGEPDHEIIVRKFFLKESSSSIAKRLDMSVSAVDTRTHRALSKLKNKLGEFDL